MIPSFEKRVRGFSIDTSLTFLLIILLIGLPFSSGVRQVLLILVMIGVYLVPYFISNGQTFGKRIQKTKVVNTDYTDASIIKLIFRDMFKVILSIASFGFYLIFCGLTMDSKNQNRTIHDKIFRTTVIELNNRTASFSSGSKNKSKGSRRDLM